MCIPKKTKVKRRTTRRDSGRKPPPLNEIPVMGRPIKRSKTDQKKEDPLKLKKKTVVNKSKSKISQPINDKGKGNFQKSIGNTKKGHGVSLLQKSRFLSRFKKRFLKKRKTESLYIKPLAEDKRKKIKKSDITSISSSSTIQKETGMENVNFKEKETNVSESTLKKSSPVKVKTKKETPTKIISSKVASPKVNSVKSNTSPNKPAKQQKFSPPKKKENVKKVKETNKKKDVKKNSNSNLKGNKCMGSEERIEIDYKAIQEERQQEVKKMQQQKCAQEYQKKISNSIDKRKVVTNKLNQKTSRGQPVMANQMEHILQKIQKAI